MPTELSTLETESSPDSTWDGILRAVSLFVPPYEAHQRTDLHRKTKPIVFSKCHDSTDRFDLGDVLQHIRHDDLKHRSHLVLLLGHQGQDSTRVVVGAFFSGDTQSPAANEERESIALPRLLFRLQPSFDLFHLGGKGIRALMPVNESDTEKTDYHNCLGELAQSKVGVRIDPATSHATFFRGNNPAGDRVSGLYEKVTSTRKHEGCDAMDGDQQERETSFTVTRLATFHVEGGPNYNYD